MSLSIIFHPEINYYNNMFYNYDERRFSKIFNKVSYKNETLDIGLSYLYKDTFVEQLPETETPRLYKFLNIKCEIYL